MLKLDQYSVVRILAIYRDFTPSLSDEDRLPKVGDIATIVEVYETPTLGYELECVLEDGSNHWLLTFSPEDADFEVVTEQRSL